MFELLVWKKKFLISKQNLKSAPKRVFSVEKLRETAIYHKKTLPILLVFFSSNSFFLVQNKILNQVYQDLVSSDQIIQ